MEILGIQIDKPFIRGALIQKSRKGVLIRSLKSALLTEPDDVKLLYMTPGNPENRPVFWGFILRLYKENFKGKIGTGLSPKDFIIRSVELKIKESRHMEEAIAFQSEATSHLNPSDILTVPLIKKKGKGSTEALLFTATRESIKSHLSELENLGIDPDGVSSVCSALCRFMQWKIPALKHAFIIDLGSSEWTCAWMEEGVLKRSHSISGGIESLLSALWEDRKKILLQKEIEGVAKQIDLLQLKSHLNPHLSEKINELRQELAKTIFSFHRDSDYKPLIFTGQVDAFVHLRDFLVESFKDLSSECRASLNTDEQKYAVAIGLSLEQATPSSLQFRRDEFFSKKNWRRLGLYALILLICSFAFATALYRFGTKENQAHKFEMVEILRSSLDRWDLGLKKKIFSGAKGEEAIDRWIQAVESNNKEYSYIPQAPKVAEVLNWISSHPLLEILKKEGDPLVIRELRYQLVQFPKIGSAQEPYLTKIDLEFQVHEALHARKFHEALLKGDDKVNPDLEITWECLPDSYRTSFFLKNRSPHVP
ncbi:MAG TPA: hypothetical protein VLE89_06630 [Chlamydiales bacterium]|nr:hypothetical protein [Chlamydiales bacterium]